MRGMQFKQVPKEQVPSNKRMVLGKYQRFFSELMDLTGSMTACVEMESKKAGYNANNELRRMAKKEGLILGWSHNANHTEFYYWLERPKTLPDHYHDRCGRVGRAPEPERTPRRVA